MILPTFPVILQARKKPCHKTGPISFPGTSTLLLPPPPTPTPLFYLLVPLSLSLCVVCVCVCDKYAITYASVSATSSYEMERH